MIPANDNFPPVKSGTPLNAANDNTPAKRKVVVDPDICIGCGVCAALCPKVYEMSNMDGKSHVIASASEADLMNSSTKDAESACPVAAITVTDEASEVKKAA